MRRALAISLLLHAWLLASGVPRFVPPQAAGALQATLRPVSAMPPLAESDAAPGVATAPRRPTADRVATGRDGEAAPVVLSVPVPARAAATVLADNAVPSTAAAADRSPAMAAQGTQAAGAGPSASPVRPGNAAGQGAEGADADGLREYRMALAREARRFKRYPERALLAGIGGTAEVRVEHAAGALAVARLERSSGDEALDAAALSMMREAAPRTAIPEPLRGRSFAVSLPVIFDASAE